MGLDTSINHMALALFHKDNIIDLFSIIFSLTTITGFRVIPGLSYLSNTRLAISLIIISSVLSVISVIRGPWIIIVAGLLFTILLLLRRIRFNDNWKSTVTISPYLGTK